MDISHDPQLDRQPLREQRFYPYRPNAWHSGSIVPTGVFMQEVGTSLSGSFSEEAVPPRFIRTPLDRPIELIARRFGGAKSKELERFMRFAVVGVSGAVIDFGLLFILQASLLPPGTVDNPNRLNVALATAIAFFTAVISNFTWTTLWVYPDSRTRSRRKQLAQFTLISVVGGVSRTAWITLSFVALGAIFMPILLPLYHVIRPDYLPSATAELKLGSIIAQLIGMAVVMLWNFFANRYWTYGDVK